MLPVLYWKDDIHQIPAGKGECLFCLMFILLHNFLMMRMWDVNESDIICCSCEQQTNDVRVY